MPIVHIKLIEGRTPDKIEKLHQKVCEAISEAVDAPKESVRIHIEEMEKTHYSVAGESISKKNK